MQAAMAQMSVQSASGGIELFSISSLHTKPGTLGPLRKPKTLIIELSWAIQENQLFLNSRIPKDKALWHHSLK